MEKQACPSCGKTDKVKKLKYGYPAPGVVSTEDIKLAGCVIRSYNPEWYCERDDVKFGKEVILTPERRAFFERNRNDETEKEQ